MKRAGVRRLRRNLAVAIGNTGGSRGGARRSSRTTQPTLPAIRWSRNTSPGRWRQARWLRTSVREMPTMTSQDFQPSLLLSMPQMQDPNFARTVVLLCDYGPDGAFGLVVNRPTDMAAQRDGPAGAADRRAATICRCTSAGRCSPSAAGSSSAISPTSAEYRTIQRGAVPVVVAGAAARGARTAAGAARARHRRLRGVGARDSSTKSSRSRRGSSAMSTSIWSSTSTRRRCGTPRSAASAPIRPRCNRHTGFTSHVRVASESTSRSCRVEGVARLAAALTT